MSIEIRQFRRKYDLELIPSSHAGIILGTLVWDAPIFGKPKFDGPGMPDHIMKAFEDAGYFDLPQMSALIKDLEDEPLIEGHLPDRTIDSSIDFALEIDIPEVSKFSAGFDTKNVKKFTFGGVKAKVMNHLQRATIDDFLDKMKADKWKDYDGKIRRVFMITELYYATAKILIDKALEATADANLVSQGITSSNKLSIGSNVEYTFNNNTVPFAMRIERVRTFNG